MIRSLLGLVAAALLLGGCYRVSYQTRMPGGGKRHEQRLHYYLLGAVGSYDIDLDEVCPEGVHAWRTDATAYGLIDFFTLGIYSPRTLVIECARRAP